MYRPALPRTWVPGVVAAASQPRHVHKCPILAERPFAGLLMWLRWRVARHGLHTSCRVLAKGKAKAVVKAPALLPNDWEAVIGIECHAQLLASTKLFSGTYEAPHGS